MLDDAMLIEEDRPEFRASASTAGAAIAVKPAGVAVGDVVIVVVAHTSGGGLQLVTTGGGAVWARSEILWLAPGPAYRSTLFAKVLDAADLANDWGFTKSGAPEVSSAVALAWTGEGATGVTIRSPTSALVETADQLTLAGFAVAGLSSCLTVVVDRDTGVSPITPPGFASRYSGLLDTFWAAGIADNDGYAGGNVTWSGLAGGFGQVGWLVEVKG